MKALPLVVFGLAALAQWAVPAIGVWQQEQTLSHGTRFRVKCSAPDPYDPLRGRYLVVRPEQTRAAWAGGTLPQGGQPLYGTFATGADGFATIDRLSVDRPESGEFIRVKAQWTGGDQVHFQWPFERYYLNERIAPEADRWLAQNLRERRSVAAEVLVLRGRAVLADLSLDGQSFREILEERIDADE